jgi:hypothetical protein
MRRGYRRQAAWMASYILLVSMHVVFGTHPRTSCLLTSILTVISCYSGDLILASRFLQRPGLPFIPLGESPELTLATIARVGHPLAQLGNAFRQSRDSTTWAISQELRSVLCNLAAYSTGVEDYVMCRPHAHSLRELADQRNYVEHKLMRLCPLKDTAGGGSNALGSLDQACWTAAVVYSLIAVFPIPHQKAPFATLATQIRLVLESSSSEIASRWDRPPVLMLWITFMGAMSATASEKSKEDKKWYHMVLERLLHRSQISTWQQLKDILMSHLWFPSTSDGDGQRLWQGIHASNPFG